VEKQGERRQSKVSSRPAGIRRTPEKIVDEIIKRDLIDPSLRQPALEAINNLKTLADFGSLWGNAKENLEWTAELRRRIEKLQKTLETMPQHMLMLVFESGEDISAELRAKRALENTAAFSIALGQLHSRCNQLEIGKPGHDGKYQHRQRQVAVAAKVLMVRSGRRVGSSSPKSPF